MIEIKTSNSLKMFTINYPSFVPLVNDNGFELFFRLYHKTTQPRVRNQRDQKTQTRTNLWVTVHVSFVKKITLTKIN